MRSGNGRSTKNLGFLGCSLKIDRYNSPRMLRPSSVLNGGNLEAPLADCQNYYNRFRVHAGESTPIPTVESQTGESQPPGWSCWILAVAAPVYCGSGFAQPGF